MLVKVHQPTRMPTAIAVRRSIKDTMRPSIASSVPLLSAKAADTKQESFPSQWNWQGEISAKSVIESST